MKLATTPEEQQAWMRQWRAAAIALEEVKTRELQAMTEADAARIVAELLPEPDYARRAAEAGATSGLVEQQRLFAKWPTRRAASLLRGTGNPAAPAPNDAGVLRTEAERARRNRHSVK